MPRRAYLFVDCNDAVPGLTGVGWVAVHDGIAAFSNAARPGPPDLAEALAFAEARFPEADEILVGGPRTELIGVPWGEAARDASLRAFDTTGIARSCAARGRALAIRWLPEDVPGIRADHFLTCAARTLAREAAWGVPLRGEVGLAPGWRSRFLSGIGGGAFNHSIAGRGLTRDQAAANVGVGPEAVDGLVASEALALNPEGLVTYASAVRLRDRLEGEGATRWPRDEFGDAYLDALAEPAQATLCVATYKGREAIGVGLSLRRGAEHAAWARKFGAAAEGARAETVRAALFALTLRLGELGGCRVVDAVSTDPWLAKILWGCDQGLPDPVRQAADGLRAAVSDLGITLRPSYLRMPFAKPPRLGELHAMARAASLMSCLAGAGVTAVHRADGALGEAGLLSACERHAAGLRLDLSGQAALIESLFRGCGIDDGARARFERLVEATVEAYRGTVVDLAPIFPGRVEGRPAVLLHGRRRAINADFAIGPDLARRWSSWHDRYDRLRAANPVLRLRELLFDVDPTIDLTRWGPRRYEAVVDWVQGRLAHTPFALSDAARDRFEGAARELVRECGGWPFSPPGSQRALQKPSRRPAPAPAPPAAGPDAAEDAGPDLDARPAA